MRILFFIDTLTSGGKERRMLELIQYLKQNTDYAIALVLTENLIYYEYVYELGIPIKIITRKGIKYDPTLFVRFHRYCNEFKPDIIHAWGRMTTFYAIPTKLILRIPLISNLIADTLGISRKSSISSFFFKMGVTFSNVILSNSKAGLEAYEITSPKAKVIWNGVRLERFEKTYDKLKKREELNIRTKFILVMIAAFSELKDYDLFLDVAKGIAELRSDVTLIGVGDGHEFVRIRKRITDEGIHNVILTGKQKDVESIIAASDVGLLCTYSEGISNFIIECMALQKPVISTDITGASKEIILEGKTGYCIRRNANEIVILINSLLDNESLRTSMGKTGKERIYEHFSIERMGKEFELLYENALLTHRKR